jgi:predicted nucleic-acid-binding Zn-ribbon protein
MWNCVNCKKEHSDVFDRCWNCGYSVHGEPPPSDLEEVQKIVEKSKSLDLLLAEKFVCTKCGKDEGTAKRVAMAGTGWSKIFDIQHNQFIPVSCTNCGYTEFYNGDILEGKDYLVSILDVIFGS